MTEKECRTIQYYGDLLQPEEYKLKERMGLPYILSDEKKKSAMEIRGGYVWSRGPHVGIYDENGIFLCNEYGALQRSIKYHNIDFIDLLDKIIPKENGIYTAFSFAAKTTILADPDHSRFTYLMQDDSGLTKIGMSINPERRKAELAVDFPTIRIVALCNTYCESELHKLFSDKRVVRNRENGQKSLEWFDLSESDILKIYRNYNFYDYSA